MNTAGWTQNSIFRKFYDKLVQGKSCFQSWAIDYDKVHLRCTLLFSLKGIGIPFFFCDTVAVWRIVKLALKNKIYISEIILCSLQDR